MPASKPVLPDADARERALDVHRSFIVQAPAGSGKTGLLTQRFLALLATVDEPEEIVAITFTRKAAAQMRDRIVAALEAAARGDAGDSDHERRTLALARAVLVRDQERGWNLVAQPARIEARTIDSLCEMLVRRRPLASRFGGRARTVDDAGEHYAEAVRRVLRHDHPAVAGILRHLDNDLPHLRGLMTEMLARRDSWLRHLQAQPLGDLRARLEANLAQAVRRELVHLRRLAPEFLAAELAVLGPFAASQVGGDGEPEIDTLSELTELPPAEIAELPCWRGIARLCLAKNGGLRRSVGRAQGFPPTSDVRDPGQRRLYQDMKRRARELSDRLGEHRHREFVQRLAAARLLPDPRYDDAQWQVVTELIELLGWAAAELRLVFAARAEVDHSEVARAAQAAIDAGERPDIRHLLVDEFQDTSLPQARLIAGLMAPGGSSPGKADAGNGGRTLLLVGDPMQSIYRFREAEVGLFLEAWKGRLGTVTLEALRLESNFRSEPEVIAELNTIFSAALPRVAETPRGAVPYASFRAARSGRGEVRVGCWPDAGREPEASRVLALVKEARRDGLDSLAILARSRHHLVTILERLRDAGIAYSAVDFEGLLQRPVIQDLRALTAAILDPTDRVAWLACLRAPWCGLSLAGLHAIACEPYALIVDRLADAAVLDRLVDGERERARRVAAALGRALDQRQRGSLRRRVSALWCELGGPATVGATAQEDAEVFLDLVGELEEGGDLPDPARLDERLERLFARPDAHSDGWLQVMTIHKAKGLEFDGVILPGLGRMARGESLRLLYWQETLAVDGHGGGLLLGPVAARAGDEGDPIYDYLKSLDKERAQNELARLLYVATTRARKVLHLLGHVGEFKDDAAGDGKIRRPHKRSALDAIWPGVRDRMLATLPPEEREDAAGDRAGATDDGGSGSGVPRAAGRTATPAHPPIRRLPADWTPPTVEPAVGVVEPPAEVPTLASLHPGAGLAARATGTVLHRLLERIALDGPRAWSLQRLEDERPVWRAALQQAGLNGAAAVAAAVDDVVLLARRTLEDERGRWILAEHEDAVCELALAAEREGQVQDYRIDRTFVADGERWVIDFKSSRHEGGDLEKFIAEECTLYAGQLEGYREVMDIYDPAHAVRTALYFCRYQRLEEIR